MSIQNPSSSHFQEPAHTRINISTIKAEPHDPFLAQKREHGNYKGQRFGLVFRGLRCEEEKQTPKLDDGVRKTVSMRADVEKQNSTSGLEVAIGRAFSMRATPLDAYCRIDGEYGYVDELAADDEESLLTQAQAQNESHNKKKKRTKVFEICRRLFGFY